jgi:hypothetical protein
LSPKTPTGRNERAIDARQMSSNMDEKNLADL